MKKTLVIILLFSFYSNAQMNVIRVVNGNNVKVDLSLINDSLAYMSFKEFGYDQYILGKYKFDGDTMIFSECSDFLDIKSDVFCSVKQGIPNGKIEIQSKFNHLFLRGESIYNSLTYRVAGSEYIAQKNPLHISLIENKVQDPFTIEFYNGGVYVGKVDVDLPHGMNLIQIRTIELYSVYDYGYNLGELLPQKLRIFNQEYHFKVILLDQ
jgi:hypothetical protein